ncbi:hypothetical protein CXG81DRAFT_11456 [Caulochytrium protostelioides]|uniref:Carrier domain-containing protein n=2 Tax=Caulochytrium protostelioides TaxID=1555241 RepID=A0A4P9X985_9FUNG|nr:hypothetical protein CXG81DRAFT_11456 [Caulochytrium protostelioides]|eukprot:RKP01893.1 hypothetical protein CXG81DRAFT_11456 [Caulochytrium protostelioides]
MTTASLLRVAEASPAHEQAAETALTPAEEARVARWKAHLGDLTELILPSDYPRPNPMRTVEAALELELMDSTILALVQLSITLRTQQQKQMPPNASPVSASGTTISPFTILLSAFSILLHKYTGEEDVTVGSSSSSTNPLVLRFQIADGDTFADVARKVYATEDMAAEDEVPFAHLTAAYARDAKIKGMAPSLFKVRFFNMTDTNENTLRDTTTEFSSSSDLTVFISQSASVKRLMPVSIRVLYNTVLFSQARIEEMCRQLALVLETAAAHPHGAVGDMKLVTDAARAVLPDPQADLHWDQYPGPITDIFARNAQAHPDRLCVLESLPSPMAGASAAFDLARTFTYDQIHRASNVLAHHLLRRGVAREDVVVLYSARCADLVVAVMAVLKAGATFSVIDPAYPPQRQNIYLSVAKPQALVILDRAGALKDDVSEFVTTQLKLKALVPALRLHDDGHLTGGAFTAPPGDLAKAPEHPGIVLGPDSIGTLSFTSGSTGIPKGVRGRHFSLTHFFPWMATEFGLSEVDRFTMLSGIAHDPIQRDIFTPLFLGAQLRIPTADDIGFPGRLAEWMAFHACTVTHLTPAMGQLLSANATAPIPQLRNAFFVGDILTKRDVMRLQTLAQNVDVINMFGTTETQRAVSYLRIPSRAAKPGFLSLQKDVMPAGKGMVDTQLLVLNKQGNLCGIGEVGEIFVRSSGLAEGYLGLEAATAERFLPNPFAVADAPTGSAGGGASLPFYHGRRDRMYKSGDLGRYRTDGSVECTGRADDQVKIRGFRIELGEIDTHLSQHEGVRENITLVRRDKYEEQTLVSYFVPNDPEQDMPLLLASIRTYLKTKLPGYAVPSVFAPLDRLPLTPNGKIDKNALPFPDTVLLSQAHQTADATDSAALSPLESQIQDVWANLLHVSRSAVALTASFWDLGGHSVAATRMMFEIRKRLAVDVPLMLVYDHPTLGAFCNAIEAIRKESLEAYTSGDRSRRNSAHPTDRSGAAAHAYAKDVDVLDQPDVWTARPGLPAAAAGGKILLTGATGFLGIFILDAVLRQSPQSHVVCVVRGATAEKARERVAHTLQQYLLPQAHMARVTVLAGDLGEPRFGLGEADWTMLTRDVSVILHNGALVHWVYPYARLRKANVLSCCTMLDLATTTTQKRVVFVSSSSVLDTDSYVDKLRQGVSVMEDDDLQGSRDTLRTGYGQSKWVAENLCFRARARGLPVSVVRPGYILGHSATGIGNSDDFLWRLIKGCIELKRVPRIANNINICPVDYVADLVAAAGFVTDPALDHRVYQAANPHRIRFDELFAQCARWYDVAAEDYLQWRSALMELTLQNTDSALYPLLHFVLDDLPTSTKSPRLDTRHAEALVSAGLLAPCHRVQDLMPLYLSFFQAIGFLPPAPTSIAVDPAAGDVAVDLAALAEQWKSLEASAGRSGH